MYVCSVYGSVRVEGLGAEHISDDMIACLGQQSVGGQRIQNGFVNRTLPHFPVGALFPTAKGGRYNA